MTCALCRRDKPLQQSHIIPEFLYSALYDSLHRFEVLSSDPSKRRLSIQKGLRELLLCAECEVQLSRHERYASLVFSGGVQPASTRTGNVVRLTGLDYSHFKLFGLSILWRAAVSRHPMFKQVKLGQYEEPLRLLIHHDNPGPPGHYGFFLTALVHAADLLPDLIVAPTRARLHNCICYRFVFGGLVWIFFVSKHPVPLPLQQAFVNEEGEMSLLVSELKDIKFLVAAVTDVLRSYRGQGAF
jgi:hypothetical protein